MHVAGDVNDDLDAALEVAKDAWLEGRPFGDVLNGNGIPNVHDHASGLPMHERVEWDWVIDGDARAAPAPPPDPDDDES